MFGKLVKHEFRATRRIIPFVFLVTVLVAVMMTVSVLLDLDAVIGLTIFLLILMVVAEVIVTYVLVIWRYYKSMCGNEAYLSFTLPIEPKMLFWSKMLVSFVWIALSYIVAAGVTMLLALVVTSGLGVSISDIADGFRYFWNLIGFAGHEAVAIPMIVFVFFITIIAGLTNVFFSVSLGSTSKFHKYGIGGPILVYIVLYFVLQIITAIATMLIPLAVRVTPTETGELSYRIVSTPMVQWFIETVKNSSVEPQTSIVGIGSYILFPVIIATLLFVTIRIIEKHTSVR
ncbi:MAG: hypothetical protein JW780_08160 [Clostridiales bacterium]|nr:hypothetical protein [Clostridiales bacterium]